MCVLVGEWCNLQARTRAVKVKTTLNSFTSYGKQSVHRLCRGCTCCESMCVRWPAFTSVSATLQNSPAQAGVESVEQVFTLVATAPPDWEMGALTLSGSAVAAALRSPHGMAVTLGTNGAIGWEVESWAEENILSVWRFWLKCWFSQHNSALKIHFGTFLWCLEKHSFLFSQPLHGR